MTFALVQFLEFLICLFALIFSREEELSESELWVWILVQVETLVLTDDGLLAESRHDEL